MSYALLAYNNRADEATLAGGSWSSTLPLSNLKTRVLSQVARSTNLLAASTQFTVTLANVRDIRVVSLPRHNLSGDATYRIRAYADVGMTQVLYDSGVSPVWLSIYMSTDIPWSYDNFWAGRIAAEDTAGFYWDLIHVLKTTVTAKYWKVEIFDTNNPAGYVQFGRLFMAAGWQPTTNMAYGASLTYESRTQVEEAWDGTEYFSDQPAFRVARFDIPYMTEYDALVNALGVQRMSGTSKEVLFCWNPDDTTYRHVRSFLGRVRQLNAIENPYPSAYKTRFEIKELL